MFLTSLAGGAKTDKQPRDSSNCRQVWAAPLGSFKLNVDADIGKYGATLVCRNDRGVRGDWCCSSGFGWEVVSVEVAETTAICKGMLLPL